MRLTVDPYALPKVGHRPDEYEDGWCVDEAMRRVAVTDGASDAFESRAWAAALARAYVDAPPDPSAAGLLDWLAEPVSQWRGRIRWDQLPWYAEEKAARGAFATLLGLSFGEAQPARSGWPWRALAIGDTCLFHVRDDQVIGSFPLERAEEFDTTPALLSSNLQYSRRGLDRPGHYRTLAGHCLPGDLFLLATDALSAWLMGSLASDPMAWARLIEPGSPEEFSTLTADLRGQGMRNDDVTLLQVWVQDDVRGLGAPGPASMPGRQP